MDSGASCHMVKESVWFKNISPEVMDIYLADKNSKMMSQGTGNVSAKTRYITLNCNKTTMYYSIDMHFFYSKDTLVVLHFKYDFWHTTATAGSDVVQSGRPIFDDFFQHLWPYIGNNTVNVVFRMVKRLWFIRIDQ
ncbi:adhesion G protein-coupled receptor B2 [Trichonephila clavipes]|nr:adhesion G protein-coupled receptor B2 [Trichonephila clavipes]